MSRVRTHFCTLVARGNGAGSRPVRYGMKGTMPATVKSSDGSGDTRDALGTTVWSRWAKCSRKRRRISAVCMSYSVLRGGRRTGAGARRGSVVGRDSGGVGTAPAGQLYLVAGGQRRVQAGARTQFGLPFRGGGPDVGAEVTDGVGEVAQALGDGPGDAGRGHLLGGAAELAHDEGADGDAHRQPEQPAHHAARRAARRARRSSLSRRAASARAWPSRRFFAAPGPPEL